jgi:carnitine-CoA ligase
MEESIDASGIPRSGEPELWELTVPQLVDRAAERWPNRVALTFDASGERLTFESLRSASLAYADALQRLGVQAGDRVAVMLRNVPAFPLSWLGLARLGATLVPVNVYAQAEDAGHVIRHSGARLIIAEETLTHTVEAAVGSGPDAPAVVVPGRDFLPASGEPATAGDSVVPDCVLNVQYTSGSTGLPKGCMLSHGYWSRLAWKLTEHFPHIREDDRILTAQPFYYIDPQVSLVVGLASGASVVMLDRFHPTSIWAKIREHRATFMYCVGVMPTLMLRVPPDERDRDHDLRLVICSGIPRELHRPIEERWGVAWHEAFGMTETGSDTHVSLDEHAGLVGSGCIGRPYPDREARVVDDEGHERPPGEVGHFELRGPGMMSGYLDDPEASAEAFRDGWFRTGDLARIEADGLVYYAGRSKDVIRRSGENVSALEVEDAILDDDAVELVACIAVPDPLRGEEIKAFVVPRAGAAFDLDAVVTAVRARLAYFKVPRYWAVRDGLPLTSSAKVHKAALREEDPAADSGVVDVGSPRRA